MADFKVPNLCGASPEFNAIQTKFESMITSALDGLETEASSLKSTLDTDVTSLVGDIKAIIPELPALPDINLQAELTSLSGLDIGTGEYNTLLADLTSKFGSALTTGGFSLDSLVSDAASLLGGGGSLCSGVPNFTVPAAGGDAVQKAVGVKQAIADAEEEKVSVLVENDNLTAAKTDLETEAKEWVNPDPTTVPTEDTGRFRPAEKTTEIVVADKEGSATKVKASTPKDLVSETTTTSGDTTRTETITTSGGTVTERKRKNISSAGITTQTVSITEYFTEDDVSFGVFDEIALKYVPLEILAVHGRDEKREPRAAWRRLYTADKRFAGERFDKSFYERFDIYELDGYNITIHDDLYDYERMSEEKANKRHGGIRYIYKVRYRYLEIYDPNFKE